MSPRYTFMLSASAAVRPFKMFTFLLSLLTAIGLGAGATQPGFEARITPSGLQFLSEFGIRELTDLISKATPDDRSGRKDVFILSIDYTLYKMHVTSVYIPSASLSTKTGVGVTVSVRGVSLAIRGNWKYDLFWPISDDGTFDVSFSGVSLAVTIEIGVDNKTGLPTVYTSRSDCSFHIGSTSIHIYGGASWLYNLFSGVIEDKVQDYFYGQVCGHWVKDLVNTNLTEWITGIKFVTSLGNTTAEIDYSLVSAPTFNASLNTFHKGEVYQIGNHTEAPFKIPTIPSDPDVSRMVFLWVTDYVANSAGYVLHNTGFLQFNVTQDEIPAELKISFNTSKFAIKFLIPQIAKLYPNMMMQMNLNTTAPPVVSITPDNVGATINGDIAAYVIQPNKTLAYLFTLGATLKVSADLGFKQSSSCLTWNSSYVSADLKLLHSAIDDFKIDLLRSNFQISCKLILIPKLNELGARGLRVPSFEDYVYMNPVVTQGQGFLKIGTDLAYQPTRSSSK